MPIAESLGTWPNGRQMSARRKGGAPLAQQRNVQISYWAREGGRRAARSDCAPFAPRRDHGRQRARSVNAMDRLAFEGRLSG